MRNAGAMEDNFYVSPDRINAPLRSRLGRSYEKCKPEGAAYAQCVESHHINKSVKQDACKPERERLDECVDNAWRAQQGRPAKKK